MNTVRDLLVFRGKKELQTVGPYDSVEAALQKMAEHNLSAILVMDDGEVVGLFSERDYARKLLLQGKSSLTTPVHEVMVRKVYYVTPDFTLDECLALMTKKQLRNLPVIDVRGKLQALINIEDVVEAVLDGKEFMISELTRYVTGSPLSAYDNPKPKNVRELFYVKPKSYEPNRTTA